MRPGTYLSCTSIALALNQAEQSTKSTRRYKLIFRFLWNKIACVITLVIPSHLFEFAAANLDRFVRRSKYLKL